MGSHMSIPSRTVKMHEEDHLLVYYPLIAFFFSFPVGKNQIGVTADIYTVN